jgi:hypothetical protein
MKLLFKYLVMVMTLNRFLFHYSMKINSLQNNSNFRHQEEKSILQFRNNPFMVI